MRYNIFTDGSCLNNPGPGGYAFIAYNEEDPIKPFLKVSGGKPETTNNEMELMAVVRALDHIIQTVAKIRTNVVHTIYIHSDSAYVINSINNNWVDFWKKNNWYTKGGTTVKNKELWERLLKQMENKKCHIRFCKVKGHSGDVNNELVDKAAVAASKRMAGESNAK